jgi:transcriptional regulator with XRE-family HTH domain
LTLMTRRDQESREAIGERIAQVRNFHRLTQREFATAISIHQSTVALFEKGRRQIKDLYIKVICDEFGVDRDWLLTGVGEMFPTSSETFEKFAQEQNLSEIDREIVRMYLDLDQELKLRMIGDFSRFCMDHQKNKILA